MDTNTQKRSVVILSVVVLAVAGVGVAFAATDTFSTDFEQYANTTTGPGDWDGGEVRNRSWSGNSQSKSFRIEGNVDVPLNNSNANTSDFNTSFLLYTGDFRADHELRITNGSGQGVEFEIDSADGIYIQEDNGTEKSVSGPSVSLQEWYRVEAKSDGSTYEFRIWKAGSGRPASANLTLSQTVTVSAEYEFGALQSGAWASVDETAFGSYNDNVRSGGGGGGTTTTTGGGVDAEEQLRIETREFMKHNTTTPFEVFAYNNSTETYDNVTADAALNVTVDDTDVVTVDLSSASITSTNNTSVNDVTNVTAEYDGLNDTQTVVVANQTIENLDILPPLQKFTATILDDNSVVILIATGVGAAAALFAGATAGVGAFPLVIIAAWVGGYAGTHVLIAALLMSIMVGLNVAQQVQIRGR